MRTALPVFCVHLFNSKYGTICYRHTSSCKRVPLSRALDALGNRWCCSSDSKLNNRAFITHYWKAHRGTPPACSRRPIDAHSPPAPLRPTPALQQLGWDPVDIVWLMEITALCQAHLNGDEKCQGSEVQPAKLSPQGGRDIWLWNQGTFGCLFCHLLLQGKWGREAGSSMGCGFLAPSP